LFKEVVGEAEGVLEKEFSKSITVDVFVGFLEEGFEFFEVVDEVILFQEALYWIRSIPLLSFCRSDVVIFFVIPTGFSEASGCFLGGAKEKERRNPSFGLSKDTLPKSWTRDFSASSHA
jgi:hypothetical protein